MAHYEPTHQTEDTYVLRANDWRPRGFLPCGCALERLCANHARLRAVEHYHPETIPDEATWEDDLEEREVAEPNAKMVELFRATRGQIRHANPLRDALLELHVPSHAYCSACDRERDIKVLGNNPDCSHRTSRCRECQRSYPCRTVQAVQSTVV